MRILVPREDVNDDTAVLIRWLAEDGATVQAGQPICELETSKTVYEVVAPEAGPLRHKAQPHDEVKVGALLAVIGEDVAEPVKAQHSAAKATKEAERYAQQHGLDLSTIKTRGIITLDDIKKPEPKKPKVPRVILIGAGSVGLQVLDILLHDPHVQVIGLLDDAPDAKERDCFGLKVLGKLNDLEALHKDDVFDQAMVTMGIADMKLRRTWFDRCKNLGLSLPNAIDPSARINRRATLGEGNVLCSFVHLGVDAHLQDNNFVAAHSSIDHHGMVGSHTLFGPGCLLSGRVTVGDGTLFGSGVIVQPNLTIGEECRLASGTVILNHVPAHTTVRLKQ